MCMQATDVIGAARRALGPVGAYLPVSFSTALNIGQHRDAATRLERAGYGAAWVNEGIGGKDVFAQLGVLMSATGRLAFGTGIANIWARAAQTMHGGAALLAAAFPERLVLGLGVGYPHQAAATGQEFGKPVTTMRGYLERMDTPGFVPAPDAGYPRIIAANGPRMLALAGEVADGTIPAGLPPEYTARARQVLGPGKLLVVGLSFIGGASQDETRAAARARVAGAPGSREARAALLAELGYAPDDIEAVSDSLVDAMVAHGDPDSVAARVREHLAAGADHVALLGDGSAFEAGMSQLERVAPALAGLA
jgi:probable F420-dependent oxidoreductase